MAYFKWLKPKLGWSGKHFPLSGVALGKQLGVGRADEIRGLAGPQGWGLAGLWEGGR